MEYRGFTIRVKSDKRYDILHLKDGELQVCGRSPSIADAKVVIDQRLEAATRAMDVLVGTDNPH